MLVSMPHVLVVEDDGLIRMDLVDLLADLGFHQVLEAANADQALVFLDENSSVSVLLTDIDMPGSMNGLSLAHIASRRLPDCRIVVISGRWQPDAGSLPHNARFLTKPVSEKRLGNLLVDLGVEP